jgi:hypothetical protein
MWQRSVRLSSAADPNKSAAPLAGSDRAADEALTGIVKPQAGQQTERMDGQRGARPSTEISQNFLLLR